MSADPVQRLTSQTSCIGTFLLLRSLGLLHCYCLCCIVTRQHTAQLQGTIDALQAQVTMLEVNACDVCTLCLIVTLGMWSHRVKGTRCANGFNPLSRSHQQQRHESACRSWRLRCGMK